MGFFVLFHCMFGNLLLIKMYFMKYGLFNMGSDFGSCLPFTVFILSSSSSYKQSLNLNALPYDIMVFDLKNIQWNMAPSGNMEVYLVMFLNNPHAC